MDIYEVPPAARPSPKLKRRFVSALCFAGAFFFFSLGWRWLSPFPGYKGRGLTSLAIEIGIVSLLYGAGMAFFGPMTRWKVVGNYKLLVDENSLPG